MTHQSGNKKYTATAEENNTLIEALQRLERIRRIYKVEKDYQVDSNSFQLDKPDYAERVKIMMKKLMKWK